MHPATATTPFTLLWALENNKKHPPFRSFESSPHTPTQQLCRAPATTPPHTAQPITSGTNATLGHTDARPKPLTESCAPNKPPYDSCAASDFLVTNPRPDLLD